MIGFPQFEFKLLPLSEFVVTERVFSNPSVLPVLVAGEDDEEDLPEGLYMRDARPHFECWGCGRECEYEGDIAEYNPNKRESNVGGCSERCIP